MTGEITAVTGEVALTTEPANGLSGAVNGEVVFVTAPTSSALHDSRNSASSDEDC